jgi:hypothetical protein
MTVALSPSKASARAVIGWLVILTVAIFVAIFLPMSHFGMLSECALGLVVSTPFHPHRNIYGQLGRKSLIVWK